MTEDQARTEGQERQPNKLLRWLRFLVVFVVMLVVLQQLVGWLRAPSLPDQAPEFDLPTLDGDTMSLAELRGKTVVLNFWATWCGPCRREIPAFSNFADENPDIPVLGISIDGTVRQLRSASDELGITYPVLLADAATLSAYKIRSIPTTVVVNPDGSVRSAHAGALYGPQLRWKTR